MGGYPSHQKRTPIRLHRPGAGSLRVGARHHVLLNHSSSTLCATARALIEATRRRGWGQVREDLYLDVGMSYPLHRTPDRKATAFGKLARSAIDRIALAGTPLLQPAN